MTPEIKAGIIFGITITLFIVGVISIGLYLYFGSYRCKDFVFFEVGHDTYISVDKLDEICDNLTVQRLLKSLISPNYAITEL